MLTMLYLFILAPTQGLFWSWRLNLSNFTPEHGFPGHRTNESFLGCCYRSVSSQEALCSFQRCRDVSVTCHRNGKGPQNEQFQSIAHPASLYLVCMAARGSLLQKLQSQKMNSRVQIKAKLS